MLKDPGVPTIQKVIKYLARLKKGEKAFEAVALIRDKCVLRKAFKMAVVELVKCREGGQALSALPKMENLDKVTIIEVLECLERSGDIVRLC